VRVTGQLGSAVVSIFEDVPALTAASRYHTKDPVLAAVRREPNLAGSSRGDGGSGGSTQQQHASQQAAAAAAVSQLRSQLLREVTAHVGCGGEYGRVVQRFGSDTLMSAWLRVQRVVRAQLQQAEREEATPEQQPQGRQQQRQQQQPQGRQQQQQQQQQGKQQPGKQQQEKQPPRRRLHVIDDESWGAAEVAVVAGMLQSREVCLDELVMTGARAELC